MFCTKCGKELLNGETVCNCENKSRFSENNITSSILGTDDLYVVCASAKPIVDECKEQKNLNNSLIKKTSTLRHLLWSAVGILSFIIMFINYADVSVDLYYTVSSSTYSGYGLLKCMNGTLGTAARMMVLLIIVNIAIIFTGFIQYKYEKFQKYTIKLMSIESKLSIIASLISFINISIQLSEFDSSWSSAQVGLGAYLNLFLSVSTIVLAKYLKKQTNVWKKRKRQREK